MRDPKWERAVRMAPGLKAMDNDPPDSPDDIVPEVSNEEKQRMGDDIAAGPTAATVDRRSLRAAMEVERETWEALPWRLEAWNAGEGWYTIEESPDRATLVPQLMEEKRKGNPNIRIVRKAFK